MRQDIFTCNPPAEWYSQISPQSRTAIEAYTGGVNAILESGGTSLPIEFTVLGYRPEQWRPLDTLSVMLYMGWSQNYAFKTELLHAAIAEKVGIQMGIEYLISANLHIYSQSKDGGGENAGVPL